MPVFNCERTVAMAVRSIVNQTFGDWELLLIDDGSTDATRKEIEAIRDERIRLLRDGQNKGLAGRLNEALGLALGRYYARMDGDDVSYPNRLETQVRFLESNPAVDLVGGGMLVFSGAGAILGKRVPPTDHEDICRWPTRGFAMAHPTYVGRVEWFRQWRFTPRVGAVCDQDLLLRSFRTSRFANVGDIVLGYREEGINLGKSLSYRVAYCRSLMSQRKTLGLGRSVLGITLMAAKVIGDATAVATGLNHRMLAHRAKATTANEEAVWRQVWQVTGGAR